MRKAISVTCKIDVEVEAEEMISRIERLYGHLDQAIYTRIIDMYIRKLWMSRDTVIEDDIEDADPNEPA